MRIGIPKETKNNEFRVGLLPAGVRELCYQGHEVYVETGAGLGVGCDDDNYQSAGAIALDSAAAVFDQSEMIIKVKEPQAEERKLLKEGQVLFTYLHLAPDYDQTVDLLSSGSICIAYETVMDNEGRLPLLAPMSEVAGRMSVQAGAMCLEKSHGGSGILLGGVPGVQQGRALILGGGVVGRNAVQMAIGMGASVTVIDCSLAVLRELDALYGNRIQTLYSTREAIEREVLSADLVIGSVLIPGAETPRLVSRQMIEKMKPGSAVVDVAIDQGGCFETSHPTTHDNPIYIIDDVVHYSVANMPGAVASTSAAALTNATLPYVLALAEMGVEAALKSDARLTRGLNIFRGQLTSKPVAEAHQLQYVAPEAVLSS